MKSVIDWIEAVIGHRDNDDDRTTRVILDRAENRTADRLARLSGKRRDEVLAESYRRADQILAERRR